MLIQEISDRRWFFCAVVIVLLAQVYMHNPKASSARAYQDLKENFTPIESTHCKKVKKRGAVEPYTYTYVRDPLARAKDGFTEVRLHACSAPHSIIVIVHACSW
jgi:hypothetical protein